jgi:hypothetical protein
MTAVKYAIAYVVSVLAAFILGKFYGAAAEQEVVAGVIREWKFATNGASLAYAEIKARVRHLI